jgi:hypothetical protein
MKTTRWMTALGLVAVAALAGCVEETGTATTLPAGMATNADESACLSAVAAQANNSVTVMSSEFSQANSVVMIGVGPTRAPWRCLVSGGVVAEVTSMANEGSL